MPPHKQDRPARESGRSGSDSGQSSSPLETVRQVGDGCGDAAPYQVMPPLSDDEYATLKADIAEHGIRVPIDVDHDGNVLDGHHRQRIAGELGITCPTRRVPLVIDEQAKLEHAFATNVHRRHLSREQRRALVEKLSEMGMSTRAIGAVVGASKDTVSRDLRAGVSDETPDDAGDETSWTWKRPVPGRARKHDTITAIRRPVGWAETGDGTKPNVCNSVLRRRRDGLPDCAGTVVWKIQTHVPGRYGGDYTGYFCDDDLPDEDRPAETLTPPKRITGTDGKTYTKPEPVKPRKHRRLRLPETYRNRATATVKSVESLSRLHQDDRFPRNRTLLKDRDGPELAMAANELVDLLEDLGIDRHQYGGGRR